MFIRKFIVGQREVLSREELERLNQCINGRQKPCAVCQNCRSILSGYAVKQLLEQRKDADRQEKLIQRGKRMGKVLEFFPA